MLNKLKEKLALKRMKVEPVKDQNINDYLAKFTCPRCHNHCTLNNIKCGGGIALRDHKIKEYNEQK